MSFNDSVSDMLTRIRNATKIKEEIVDVPSSKLKEQIAQKFLEEGFIVRYETLAKGNRKTIRINLKYDKAKKLGVKVLKEDAFLSMIS